MAYGYDALYRLTSDVRTGTGSYTKSYDYDLAGNVTTLNGSTFATYDNANKISALSGGSLTNTGGNITAVNGAGYTSATMSYENRDKLRTQAMSGTTWTYLYNFTGLRVLRKPSGTTSTWTWYVYSGDKVVGEIGTSGASMAYTWGADGLVSQRIIGSSSTAYYHHGAQGETRYLTSSAGSVLNSYVYSAYGTIVASSGSTFNKHLYGGKVGYYTDGPMSLILAGHRWYSPNLMRWTSRDPISFEGGENVYGYVRANPVKYFDPDGLDTTIIINNNMPVTGDHVGMIVDDGKGNAVLYDPSGSYKDQSSNPMGSGRTYENENVDIFDYLDFQLNDGLDVDLYRFPTTPEEEDQIRKRINAQGGCGVLQCSICVSSAISGVGPFKDIKPVFFPRSLKDELESLLK